MQVHHGNEGHDSYFQDSNCYIVDHAANNIFYL